MDKNNEKTQRKIKTSSLTSVRPLVAHKVRLPLANFATRLANVLDHALDTVRAEVASEMTGMNKNTSTLGTDVR